jgi:nitrogen regulatory protein PII
MKLLIITAVTEFEAAIKQLLKKSGVLHYSYQNVIGNTQPKTEALETNWFASEYSEIESILFYAILPKQNIQKVFDNVEIFNQQQKSSTRVHIVSLAIEKSN